MASTKRVSPWQHYHIAETLKGQRTADSARHGFFRYDQGRDGANAAVRQMAQRKAKEFGACGEVYRLGTGLWTATKWNKDANDYSASGPEFEIVESVSYSKRVCFDHGCTPEQYRVAS